jgi:hypothetical protein
MAIVRGICMLFGSMSIVAGLVLIAYMFDWNVV